MDSRPSIVFLVMSCSYNFFCKKHSLQDFILFWVLCSEAYVPFHRYPCSSLFGWLKSLGFWKRSMKAHKGTEIGKGDSWVTPSSLESSVHLESCSLFPRLVKPFHPRIMETTEFNKFLFWLLWCSLYYFLSEDGTYGY